MSILDKLKQAWDETRDEAATKGAELAAKQAAAAAKAALAAAGDEFLDDAEHMLDEAEKAREGRPDYAPSPDKAGDIASYIHDIAGDAEQIRKTRAERQAAAAEELARLKAELRGEE